MPKLEMPFNNPYTYPGHSGIDYPQPEGTPFRASDDGVISWLGQNRRGGYFVWVNYDSIVPRVGYHHMPSHVGVPPVGTRFRKYDRLGYVGNTGNSTGPHLHSEVEGYATTDGYWKFFDRTKVLPVSGGNSAGNSAVTHEMENDEMVASFVNVPGKTGVRRGGCYAMMRDNKGNLFTRFISTKYMKGAPTVDTDRALKELQQSFGKGSFV